MFKWETIKNAHLFEDYLKKEKNKFNLNYIILYFF